MDGLQGWICQQFGPEGFLILDDTGFPKQGTNSVGVARQYTRTLGKVERYQVAVTLQFATPRDVVGLDARLYLPKSWIDDADRCRAAGIPERISDHPTWEPGLAMIRRARANGLCGIVLADRLFGTVTKFRSHWSIKNSLHWQLNVTFGEDKCWVRQGDADANCSLLKNEKTAKVGVKSKRLMAGWRDVADTPETMNAHPSRAKRSLKSP